MVTFCVSYVLESTKFRLWVWCTGWYLGTVGRLSVGDCRVVAGVEPFSVPSRDVSVSHLLDLVLWVAIAGYH